mmetsp:Transcript_12205/g.51416  ORF Transcript_12205/g.51416 Transcript_12205/m.51416 type:complete len:272 (+) Transcript_12205:1250-2065(+)
MAGIRRPMERTTSGGRTAFRAACTFTLPVVPLAYAPADIPSSDSRLVLPAPPPDSEPPPPVPSRRLRESWAPPSSERGRTCSARCGLSGRLLERRIGGGARGAACCCIGRSALSSASADSRRSASCAILASLSMRLVSAAARNAEISCASGWATAATTLSATLCATSSISSLPRADASRRRRAALEPIESAARQRSHATRRMRTRQPSLDASTPHASVSASNPAPAPLASTFVPRRTAGATRSPPGSSSDSEQGTASRGVGARRGRRMFAP